MSDIDSAFDVPDHIMNSLRSGLEIIANLQEMEQEKLLNWARFPRASGLFGDNKSFVSETGLREKHADRVRIAVVMMVGSLRESPVTAEEFIEAGLNNTAFTQAEIYGLKRFAQMIIAVRAELKRESDLVQLQDVVLPTLMEFELTLDARVQILDGVVANAIPVVIAFVDTDAEDQLVWFQMNEQRVRELRDKLTTKLHEIDTLKEWLRVSTQFVN